MKLSEEHVRSYIDDIRYIELLKFLTWSGDVSPAWYGNYMPATHSDDDELVNIARFNRDHYLFYRTLVEDHVEKRGKILDLGCGTGQRSAMLTRYADEVMGIDNDPLRVGAACHLNNGGGRINYALCDIMKNDPTGQYDYLFCVEVIEHIPIDWQSAFIRAALRWLLPSGKMLITTPRDAVVTRKPPHIGLWEPADAQRLAAEFGGKMEYYNVDNLMHSEDPRCRDGAVTHYVMVIIA